MQRTLSTSLVLATFALTSVACSDPSIDGLDAELSEQDQIVENLLEVGYPESEIEIREDGTVYVGGDAHVTLDASYEMIDHDHDHDHAEEGEGFRQYRTDNLVAPNGRRTIFITGYSGSGTAADLDATMKEALVDAVTEYNALNLNLRFALSFTTTAGDITVYREAGYAGGHAGFPSGGNPYPLAYIGGDTTSYGLAVVKHVIKHEIGHALGMRHSDYYNRSISCGQGGNEGHAGVGANHIPGTPTNAWFDGSVMNSCFHSGSNGAWTGDDVTAFQVLYRTAASPGWCAHAGAQLHEGDFDGDGNRDLMCHDVNSGHKWIDFGNNGITGTDWERAAGWCNHAGSEFLVGDFDGDGSDDWMCHDGAGSKWIDYANNGFWGTDWVRASGWCIAGSDDFAVLDVNGDSRDDMVCWHGVYKWLDYANNGFWGTDWEGTAG